MSKSSPRRRSAADRPVDDPAVPGAEPADAETAEQPAASDGGGTPRRRPVRDWTPLLLARAAHPRQAVLTALGLAAAAALDGRASREIALVAVTVVVGQ